ILAKHYDVIAQQLESIMGSSVSPAPATVAPATTPDPAPVATPPAPATPTPIPATDSTVVENTPATKPGKKVIEPINDLNADTKPKLDELVAKEEAKGQAAAAPVPDSHVAIEPPAPDSKIDPNSIAL
ncbi:hypothetical protein KC959_04110, partial [Candidatus Saccharibacteria bacterium]|nr:hypothetical protein [Candidatus Saccharibacteria bacterium]